MSVLSFHRTASLLLFLTASVMSSFAHANGRSTQIRIPCGQKPYPACKEVADEIKKGVLSELKSTEASKKKLVDLVYEGDFAALSKGKVAKSAPPICGAVGHVFNQCQSELDSNHKKESCGDVASMAFVGPSKLVTSLGDRHSGKETAHVSGALVVALAHYYQDTINQVVRAYSISVPKSESQSICAAPATDLAKSIADLDRLRNKSNMERCDSQDLTICHSQEVLMGAYAAVKTMFKEVALCRIIEQADASYESYYTKAIKKVETNVINKCRRLANDDNGRLANCYKSEYENHIQSEMNSIWPRAKESCIGASFFSLSGILVLLSFLGRRLTSSPVALTVLVSAGVISVGSNDAHALFNNTGAKEVCRLEDQNGRVIYEWEWRKNSNSEARRVCRTLPIVCNLKDIEPWLKYQKERGGNIKDQISFRKVSEKLDVYDFSQMKLAKVFYRNENRKRKREQLDTKICGQVKVTPCGAGTVEMGGKCVAPLVNIDVDDLIQEMDQTHETATASIQGAHNHNSDSNDVKTDETLLPQTAAAVESQVASDFDSKKAVGSDSQKSALSSGIKPNLGGGSVAGSGANAGSGGLGGFGSVQTEPSSVVDAPSGANQDGSARYAATDTNSAYQNAGGGGASGASGANTSRSGSSLNFGKFGASAGAGEGTGGEASFGGERNPASSDGEASAKNGEDPDDYFKRIGSGEDLFHKVTLRYRAKAIGIAKSNLESTLQKIAQPKH